MRRGHNKEDQFEPEEAINTAPTSKSKQGQQFGRPEAEVVNNRIARRGKEKRTADDAPRTGSTVVENVDKIIEIIEVERQVRIRSIVEELKIDHKTVLNHLRKVGLKKGRCLGATPINNKKHDGPHFNMRSLGQTE
ncbi:hypothetical protein TNCV_3794231 [Trichonephila clavipes]|nr:hypothetical protein TNCV_3794231 [Trichonephila clavipes]